MTAPVIDEPRFLTYPGAKRPDRHRWVDSYGVRLHVCEWGDADGPPLFLVHGGSDFAGTFDVFAPLLAAAGWRVISWDHRGHGDSEHAALYSWDADVRDALSVLDATTPDAVPVVAHSKGGGMMLQLAEALPYRLSKLVVIDGLPSRDPAPDVSDHEHRKFTAKTLADWLDHRRAAHISLRKAGTLEELARRRKRMNPRLPDDWLRYLVTIGARRDPDGWRWKLDPAIRFGGFGPWSPEWSLQRLKGLKVPLLGLTATVEEEMGWGTNHRALLPYLPPRAEIIPFANTGHFIHIEHPHKVAELVREFLR
ncbi:alpha/beta hydrolase [Tepidiforma sp.]|uniref:alpha/beta fold hydrolase n=1 Tax=Tepidiforma sp. TaxID=2682230 RepID=UPI002ADDF7E2|nr:alpha/beta hydrolase [Tepidiforma sp.]